MVFEDRMKTFAALLLFAPLLGAQTLAPTRVIRATGTGTVSTKPDQAKVNVGVITTAPTADEASSQNATQVDNVIKALTAVLGSSSPIRTISYSITPNYRNQPNQPQTITGYTATNTLEVTISNLNIVGKVVDAAARTGGANQISGLRFLLTNADAATQAALSAAAKQARSHAESIASGLGGRIGSVLAASEGGSSVPIVYADTRLGATGANTPTPIETGTLDVRATVTVDVEYLP
jgi:uncharacterized protein